MLAAALGRLSDCRNQWVADGSLAEKARVIVRETRCRPGAVGIMVALNATRWGSYVQDFKDDSPGRLSKGPLVDFSLRRPQDVAGVIQYRFSDFIDSS
jgi:hypothetical protein